MSRSSLARYQSRVPARLPIDASDFLLLCLFTLGGAMTISGSTQQWYGPAGLCVLSIAFCVVVVRARLRALQPGQMPEFLTVFLTFEILNKTLTIISLAAGQAYMTVWEAADLVTPLYAFRAEAVLLAFLVLFTLGWYLARPRRIISASSHKRARPRTLVLFYLAALAGWFVTDHLPALHLGALTPFLYYGALAAIGLLLMSDTAYGLRGRRWLLSIGLLSPLFLVGMVSGTKSGMIVVALPVLIAGLTHGLRRVMFFTGILAVFMVLVGIPLAQTMRAANWASTGGHEDIGVVEGLDRVADEYTSGRASHLIASTFVGFAHRASSAQMGGVVMRVAEQDGFIGAVTIHILPVIFIPRALWSEKPSFSPGSWFTWYLGKAPTPKAARSSTAMMLGTEIYWMAGLWSLIPVSLALGVLYALIWRGLLRISATSLMGFAGMYTLYEVGIRFEESNALYAIAQPVTYLVYTTVLAFAECRLWPIIRGLVPK